MNVAFYCETPKNRIPQFKDKIELTCDLHRTSCPAEFFHSGIAGRIRRSYRRLRRYGLTASEARKEIIETLFAVTLSDAADYRSLTDDGGAINNTTPR